MGYRSNRGGFLAVVAGFALVLTGTVVEDAGAEAGAGSGRIVDTGQDRCYHDYGETSCRRPGEAFFGQDAQYRGRPPAYRDNADGTVSDLNTGLMWSKAVDPNKVSLEEALDQAERLTLGGHRDWRVPSIKELYTLIDFRGYTGFSGRRGPSDRVPSNAVPFINTDYFDFRYDGSGERYIDAQWLSHTRYVSTTMGGADTLFGVNFADGRIKGYGYRHRNRRRGHHGREKRFFVRFVRGRPYGENRFVDQGDRTVLDRTTGLVWAKADSGRPMNWRDALAFAENYHLAGHDDWRLPNAKELHSIVDYRRSPDTTDSPALDPIFQTTAVTNEKGETDYPYFWTSTTHLDGPRPGRMAVYFAFGRAIGQMRGRVMDVHGAGAQRSDPKSGRAGMGHGPQGDSRRVQNFVRCVRGGGVRLATAGARRSPDRYPEKIAGVQSGTSYDYGRAANRYPERRRNRSRQDGYGNSGYGDSGYGYGRSGYGRESTPAFGGYSEGRGGGARGPGSGAHFVQRLDRNGDNRVSRSEFDGPPDRFDYHDSNGDGYLSESEAPQGPPPGHRPF